MPQANWSPQANLELEEVACYIAMHDGRPATADRIVREVHELYNLIVSQAEMGEARPEFGVGCRVFSFEKRWTILYRPVSDGIDVLRFVDGRRDYDHLF